MLIHLGRPDRSDGAARRNIATTSHVPVAHNAAAARHAPEHAIVQRYESVRYDADERPELPSRGEERLEGSKEEGSTAEGSKEEG